MCKKLVNDFESKCLTNYEFYNRFVEKNYSKVSVLGLFCEAGNLKCKTNSTRPT